MEDGNRPEGLWGEVYNKQTGSKTRKVTQPYFEFTRWEVEAVDVQLEQIKKNLNLK